MSYLFRQIICAKWCERVYGGASSSGSIFVAANCFSMASPIVCQVSGGRVCGIDGSHPKTFDSHYHKIINTYNVNRVMWVCMSGYATVRGTLVHWNEHGTPIAHWRRYYYLSIISYNRNDCVRCYCYLTPGVRQLRLRATGFVLVACVCVCATVHSVQVGLAYSECESLVLMGKLSHRISSQAKICWLRLGSICWFWISACDTNYGCERRRLLILCKIYKYISNRCGHKIRIKFVSFLFLTFSLSSLFQTPDLWFDRVNVEFISESPPP